MKVDGQAHRSIWIENDAVVKIIDQTLLPWDFSPLALHNLPDAAKAISDMQVRGAPLIGVTAAYGVALAMRQDSSNEALENALSCLLKTRPTAVNLKWALQRVGACLRPLPPAQRYVAALELAAELADEDVQINSAIGDVGAELLTALSMQKGRALNVLTHCNAGWLATVDWGTALSPIYKAHDASVSIHVWVDETRPRNQGALTAWELQNHGVPHTYIVDNAGGLLMQRGQVDAVIVGCDRVAANGDVCNKIGTYLKALAAKAEGVPFYVALPSPTYDAALASGAEIPIEERSEDEVSFLDEQRITPKGTPVSNLAFDITPAYLVSGYITDKGLLTQPQLGLLVS